MTLYFVSTPIGHLKDISLHALELLKSCAYILCEDTRHSKLLLDAYGIQTPLKSFHQFNEKSREEEIIADLRGGKDVAVISDAGTPGICDPGSALVQRCWQEDLPVRGAPGASAWLLALTLCPFDKQAFQFLGFLGKKEGEKRALLIEMLLYRGTSICYETPHRIEETLRLIARLAPERKVCLMRELTKMHEEHLHGTAQEVLARLQPRGEMVLLIERYQENFSNLSAKEHVRRLQDDFGLDKNEAIKLAAELRHCPKREVYKKVLQESLNSPLA